MVRINSKNSKFFFCLLSPFIDPKLQLNHGDEVRMDVLGRWKEVFLFTCGSVYLGINSRYWISQEIILSLLSLSSTCGGWGEYIHDEIYKDIEFPREDPDFEAYYQSTLESYLYEYYLLERGVALNVNQNLKVQCELIENIMIIILPIPPFSHKILWYYLLALLRFVFSSENCLFHQINRRATCSSKALLYTAIVIFNLFSLGHSWRSRFSLVHTSLIQFVANGAAIKIDILQLTRFRWILPS